MALSPTIGEFVADVATEGPVCVAGGRTQWTVGGPVDPACRVLRAPSGVVHHEPAEMTVRVGAGTTLADLHGALAAAGQTTVLAGATGATVGGVLAVGRSGVRRLRDGPLRDAVLEIRYVSAEGRLVVAGGPTVKNVTGYDLCRLLVGSLGTLGLFGEVVLRTRPVPEVSQWLAGPADPKAVAAALHRPSSVLWDGTTTWVLLEGYAPDVRDQARIVAGAGLREVGGPPALPPFRRSLRPADVAALDPSTLRFVAEVGVGVVHADQPGPARPPSSEVAVIHRRLKQAFDPTGRLSPGRCVLPGGAR